MQLNLKFIVKRFGVFFITALTSMFLVAAEYTWTGAGGDDHGWRTPANWGRTDNKYPVSGDRAIFPENCNAEVELGATNNYEAVNQLKVLAGAFVRFYAADPTAETRLDLKSAWEVDNAGNTIEFDHIRVDGNKALVLGDGAVLTVKNNSDLRLGNTTVKKAARVSILSGSVVSSGWIDADSSVGTLLAVDNATWAASGEFAFKNTATNLLSNGATMKISTNLSINGPNTLLSIDNAALLVKDAANLGTATPGGGRILFKGDNPMLKSISGSEFRDGVNSANMTSHIDFDFVVPEGGFAAPPIQWMGQQAFRNNGNSPNGYFRFNVLPSSPALSAGTQTDCILFYSLNGIVSSKATNGDSTTSAQRLSDETGTAESSTVALWATIGSGSAATPTATGPGCLLNYHSTKVDRNVITVSGRVSALASNGDATHVELWCGTADNAATMEYVATVVPESAPSRISTTFSTPEDNGEVTYYFQWRLFDIGTGGVTNYNDVTETFNGMTKDTTTYTWQAVNGDWNGDWHDTAHWTGDLPSAYGYPRTGNSTAVFPAGTNIVVTISDNEAVGTLDLSAYDAFAGKTVDVTFKGATATGTNKVLTVSTLFDITGPLGTVTIDNAAIKVNSNDIKPGPSMTLRLVNGAYFYSSGGWETSSIGNWPTTLELHGKSVMSIGEVFTRNGKKIVIDDSRLVFRSQVQLSRNGAGGDMVFMGANPVAYFDTTTANCLYLSGNPDNNFIFHVPVGGFDAPPIQCRSDNTRGLFTGGKTSGKLNFIVADESPCYATTCNFTAPLISWTSTVGITTTLLTYAGVSDGGAFLLGTSATADYGFVNAASFSGTAKSLGVHVVSVAHDDRLAVASDASQPLDGYDPALGETNGYAANDSVTMTAPTGVTSNGVHYTCTGYTLTEYAAGDAATVVATTTVTDGTSSFAYTFPAGRAEITWHYAESYLVTATAVNDAGGTVAKSADFTTSSSPVTLTASTITEGKEFQYWYGDVPYESRYANPLVISGDQAKSVVAFFGATAANSGTRVATWNTPGGNKYKNWFDAETWTDGIVPGTNDTAVLVSTRGDTHQGQYKAKFFVPSFFSVRDLVVSNACVYVAADPTDNNLPGLSQDQHGYKYYSVGKSYDAARTEPIGFDVSGNVLLRRYNAALVNQNGTIVVGGSQQRCFTKVNIGGGLVLENGAFQVNAGHPFDFTLNPAKAIDGPNGFIEFPYADELWRGGNYLKVSGDVVLAASSGTATNFLQVANDFRTGAAVWLDVVGDVTVGEGAAITSWRGGYGKFNSAGTASGSDYSMCPGGHCKNDNTSGGSYGGLGGAETQNPAQQTATTHVATYGYEFFPIHPGSPNGGNGGVDSRGGGSIRLDCATLNLDGGLSANGHNGGGNKGASSGGSILVICDTFSAGDNCAIVAEGGAPNGSNAGAGGGRIAVCEGLTDDQIASLHNTKTVPEGVTASSLVEKLGSRASAAALVATTDRSVGWDGTAWYLVNTAGKKTLTVMGDPTNLGAPTPAYGPQVYEEGDEISVSAPEAAFTTADNRSRRVAVGYTLTDTATGTLVADTAVTSTNIVMNADYTLTWKLTTLQHALDLDVATAGGSITTNAIGSAGEIWQNDGAELSITAIPASGWRFVGWMGEIDEAAQAAATFTTNVTGGLRVRAVFVSDTDGTATWTGGGDGTSFLDAANWSTGKIPGPQNDVVIGGGASVTGAVGLVFNIKSLTVESGASLSVLPEGNYSTRTKNPHVDADGVLLYDLHDCGLVVSSDIMVGGTLVVGSRHSLAKATVAVGGAFTIAEGASVTVNGGYDDALIGATATPALWRNYGAVASAGGALTVNGTLALYGDAMSGSPVEVAANRLVVGATGALHSDGGGWGWTTIGVIYDYSLGASTYYGSYNGGAYGGFGGGYGNDPSAVTDYGNKRIYGDALRPYLPGSSGVNNYYPFGGGALRIVVEGQISNAGRISANGVTAGGSTGGGSGGGIWITCHKFVNGAEGSLLARGGNNTNNGGAGGGGRILVCERLDAEKINALYTTGVVPEKVTATEITDANLAEFSAGTISADGGTNVNNSASYPCWSGTAGSIWWLRGRALGTSIKVR